MVGRFLALVLMAGAFGGAAQAQDRAASQRQALVDLAYVIGQSHALRQVCTGAGDQFWRGRMMRLLQTEAPDAAFERRLKEAFNTGFVAAQQAFPACDAQSRREQVQAAARGRTLSIALGRATADEETAR